MDLAKKSIKWLIAAVAVFALVLTAVFASGTFATANATEPDEDEFVNVGAIVVASEVVAPGVTSTYPNLLAGTARTITATFYFEMPDVVPTTPTVEIAPVLVTPNGSVRPSAISINGNFGTNVSAVGNNNTANYAGGTASKVLLSLVIPADSDLSYYNGVSNNAIVENKYFYTATFNLAADAAAGEYSFADAAQISPNSDPEIYVPTFTSPTFNIRQVIEIPTAVNATYDGEEHTGVATSANYTISANGTQTDAGEYTLTVSLTDPDSTCWTGNTISDQTVDWEISPKEVNLVFDAASYTSVYADALDDITPIVDANTPLVDEDDLGDLGYSAKNSSNETVTLSSASPVGTYTLTVTYTANPNYEVTAGTASYEITVKAIPVPVVVTDTYTYDASAHSIVFAEYDSTYVSIAAVSETNYGTYNVAVALVDDVNTEWAETLPTYTLTINKMQIAIPVVVTDTYTYDASAHSIVFEEYDTTYVSIAAVSETNYGTYNVAVALVDSTNTEWAETLPTYTLTINKMQIAIPVVVTDTYTYDGQPKSIVFAEYDSTYVSIATVSETDYGTYNVAVSLVDDANTEWAETLPTYTLTINKLQIAIPVVTTSTYTYDASAHSIVFAAYNTNYVSIAEVSETDVGTYNVAVALVDSTNTEWAETLPTYTLTINVKNVVVPVVDEDTFDYDASAKSIIFEEDSLVDASWYTITGNTLTRPGSTTVTIALKEQYGDNIAWADELPTYTLTVNAVQVTVTFTYSFGNDVVTYAEAASYDVCTPITAAPALRFFRTDGFVFDNAAATEFTLEMDGETINAEYFYNVGKGDVDGNGVVTAYDVLQMKLSYIDAIPAENHLADADAAWAKRTTEGDFVLVTALDANGNGTFRINDITAAREALATGYAYKIIVNEEDTGVTGQSIKKINRVTVSTYAALVSAVRMGYPVTLGTDITAATEDFNEDLQIPVDIDLNGNKLTVKSFTLNTDSEDLTLSIVGSIADGDAIGYIYTVDGISVTAPNGNVKVKNVNGYSYEGTTVTLAAASSSLHIEKEVAFYLYHMKNSNEEILSLADFKETETATTDALADFADEKIEETDAKITAMTTKKDELAALEAEKADLIAAEADEEDINAKIDEINAKGAEIVGLEVKKAPVEVPVDTHVVVEEQANLTVEQITVVAPKGEDTTAATFSINVKNTAAEMITVDISEVKEIIEEVNYYFVEEVEITAEANNVTVVSGENEATVSDNVAQIGTTGYASLQAAINAAENGDVIVLLKNVDDGTGLEIKDNTVKNITIDFNGKTYTMVTGSVGSTGTETQAMHWSNGSTVTLKNGTFVVSETAATVNGTNGKLVKMAMQNYAALTIKNMTLDFSNIVVRNYGTYTGADAPYSGLEIPLFNLNAGSMTIEDNTTITMPANSTKGVLIEIPNAATIKNSTINGYVSLGQFDSNVTIVNSTTSGVVSYFAGYGVKHSGNVYRLGGVSVTNATELQAALDAGAIIIDVENNFNAPNPIAVTKSTIINGYDHTITSNGNRIMNVTEAGVVLTINDLTMTSATSERGLNIWDSATDTDITLNNVTIDAHLYAINYVNGADNETLTINNSSITGWAAINAHCNNSTFTVTDSTLYGINRNCDSQYGFSTVVIDGDSLFGSQEGDHGVDNTFVFDGCTIIAEVTLTHQYWISFQYAATGNVASVVVNNCEILDAPNGNDKSADMKIDGTNNAVVMALSAEQYAIVAAKHFNITDNGNGTYTIMPKTANISYFGTPYNFYDVFENGWLEDTEAFTLTDDVVLDTDVVFARNRAAAIAVSGGTFEMDLDGNTISGVGKILLPVGVTCVTDSDVSIAGIFEAPEGEVIIESVDADGNYIYAVSKAYVKTKAEFTSAITAGAKEIVICADINLSMYTYNRDMDITIDLNGHTLTTTMTGITFSAARTLNIKDSSENGTGAINSTGNYAINMGTASTEDTEINIYGGTLTGKTSAAVKVNDGTLNVYGGTLTCPAADKYAILNYQGYAGTVNIMDGTFTAAIAVANNGTGTVNIYGGTFSADPSDFVAPCYVAVEDEGTWTVVLNEITITTFAELKAAIAAVNAGTSVYPTLIIANDIQFEEELQINKSVYIMGDGETKFIGYDASTKYDEAFYINVADEDQEITIDGIVFDHFCYYSNVANKTKATDSAVKNGVAYITYGGDCPASTTLYITGCKFIGTARDMINASSTKGCKGFIAIEDCEFDATDRLSSTLNMLSFYGNEDAELSVIITGCTFKEASEQNATWATSAIASFGNADLTIVGCEFIACQIGIAIDNTFDRLYSTSTYPVYYNTTVNLVENTYTNCYFGYFGEFFVDDVSEIPEEAELYTDEPFTYGDAEATQFHFAAEYDVYEAGEAGEAQHRIYLCYYVKAMVAVGGGEGAQGNPGLDD